MSRKSFCRSGSQTPFFRGREATTRNGSPVRRLHKRMICFFFAKGCFLSGTIFCSKRYVYRIIAHNRTNTKKSQPIEQYLNSIWRKRSPDERCEEKMEDSEKQQRKSTVYNNTEGSLEAVQRKEKTRSRNFRKE